ncbi:RCC1 and BTB domain-containing protein 1-like [Camponotus floridanus]|nr:RCC1 and BTB domain-containing protein 1-like [Camponotus floridanus]XP_025269508.1 RCC1 and BTB domain-containing protein 1-like [Camponotus floridanus]
MSEALMFVNMPLTVFADDDFKYMDEEIDVLKCWETLFDNPSSSDLTIQVEGQPIHVHKAILKKRSSYFKTIFQDDSVKNQIKRKKKEKDVIEHFEYSYIVYKAFLKYLYTDIVDLSVKELLKLLDLAIAYCENKLEKYCRLEIKRKTTV